MIPPTIPLSSIIEGTRARDTKKYGNLDGLIASLESIGSIQPIVLSKNLDDTFALVAGGRRFRCFQQMGVTELHHAATLTPGTYGFVFADEVPEHRRKEAELDENLQRLDMDWIDNVLLIHDIHWAKKHIDRDWGVRQTAQLMGNTYSYANINYAIKAAKLLRAGDKEVLACENISAVTQLLLKRGEDKALAEMQKRVLPVALIKPAVTTDLNTFLDQLNNDITQRPAEPESSKALEALGINLTLSVLPVVVPLTEIPLSQMFYLGDSVRQQGDLPSVLSYFDSASINHIVTDIPYGVDMENHREGFVVDVKNEHEIEANIELMLPFLQEAYRIIKPGGFCVFWYDLDHHEKLQVWANQVGWKVQKWPIIWKKEHICRNQAYQYNFTKNFEVAMVLRKDSETVLRGSHTTCFWEGSNMSERQLYNNPFAKPFELWKFIYSAIAFVGQSTLDPFMGEASACAAAINCGLIPYGVEINPQHFNRGIERVKGVYALLHKSNIKFT